MVGGEGRRLPWASPAQGSTVCLVLGPTQVTHTQPQLQPPKLSRAGGFLSFLYKQILNMKVKAKNYPRHKNSHRPQSQCPTLSSSSPAWCL